MVVYTGTRVETKVFVFIFSRKFVTGIAFREKKLTKRYENNEKYTFAKTKILCKNFHENENIRENKNFSQKLSRKRKFAPFSFQP
jgi:hypothetical protein